MFIIHKVFHCLFFVVIFFMHIYTKPAHFLRQSKEEITKKNKIMKKNMYLNVFIRFAIVGSIATFISGIDSIFDNPVGLFVISVLLATLIAGIAVCGYAVLNWIAPEKAKKFISMLIFCDDTEDKPMK